MARTGAAWDKNTAFWAGQCDEQECELCGSKEEADHIWTCTSLKAHRRRVDEDIASLDPKKLPAAVKQGVAPAMKANPRNSFWGKQEEEETDYKLRYLCGIIRETYLGQKVKDSTKGLGDNTTAREHMQHRINEHDGIDLPLPEEVKYGQVPEKPNVFSDGSVKNPKEATWRIGGAGTWWPGRKIETMRASETEENTHAL